MKTTNIPLSDEFRKHTLAGAHGFLELLLSQYACVRPEGIHVNGPCNRFT